MTDMNRRAFLRTTAATALASSVLLTPLWGSAQLPLRKFIMNLNVGQIGVKATPLEAVRLARQHGYGAVTPMTGSLSKYSEAELGQPFFAPRSPTKGGLLARRWASPVGEMKSNGIVWGAGVLSPFFEPAFLRGLVKIGYDGPVGTEPFDKSLSEMSAEEAMTTATAAMKKAFALIG